MSIKWKIALGVVILLFIVLMQLNTQSKAKQYFEDFNSARIDGEIESVDVVMKSIGFKLIGGREFVFSPVKVDKSDSIQLFKNDAARGDKVLKEPYSDTLYLKKGNLVKKYTFIKF
jgi:hypothetical protein